MSIMRMRKFFGKPLKVGKGKRTFALLTPAGIVFVLLIIVLLVGTYYSFGGPQGGGPDEGPAAKLTANVVTIDGKPITRGQYLMALDIAQRNFGEGIDATQMRYVKTSILDSIIDNHLKEAAVKRERIKVTKADIEAYRDSKVEEIKQQRYPDTKSLRDYLERKSMSLEQLDESIRENLPDDESIKKQLQFDKLQEQVESQVTMTDEQLKESFTEVKARHILITPEYMQQKAELEKALEKTPDAAGEDKPAGEQQKPEAEGETEAASNDAPKTELEAKISEEQAKQQARELADKLLADINGGADFAKLAQEQSQDFGSAPDGGDLGWFKRGRMVPEFEKAAFETEPGKLSQIVETEYGFHIIKVEEKRQELPEDFDSQKESYREQAMSQEKMRVWQQYEKQLRDDAKVEIIDPELKAYSLLDEGNKTEGIAYLEAAIKLDADNITARYELAQLYEQAGMLKEAIEQLGKVTTNEYGARSPQAHFRLAELKEKNADTDGAIQEYKSASDWATAFTQGNYMMHMRLRGKFEELKKDDLAEQEQTWIDDFMANQSESGFGGGMPITIPSQ